MTESLIIINKSNTLLSMNIYSSFVLILLDDIISNNYSKNNPNYLYYLRIESTQSKELALYVPTLSQVLHMVS